MSNISNPQYPPATERTLKILDLFVDTTEPKSVKEISCLLTIPTASVYRIIRCLVDTGYLQESPGQADKYYLGYKINILAKNFAYSIPNIATPLMGELAKQTSQACQLSILSSDAVVTICQTLPSSTITVIASIGERIPVNISAAGKVLISLLPREQQRSFLESAWRWRAKNTMYTIDDIDVFSAKLPEIAKMGYALDIEEYALGIGCLAVPVFDKTNTPIAAIGLTGPIKNYRDPAVVSKRVKELLAISRKITSLI